MPKRLRQELSDSTPMTSELQSEISEAIMDPDLIETETPMVPKLDTEKVLNEG